jgi:hypothetical protein
MNKAMVVSTGPSLMRSGRGTSMYSRRGKSTINEYLCFSKDPVEEAERKRQMKVKILFGYHPEERRREELEEKTLNILKTGGYLKKASRPQWQLDIMKMEAAARAEAEAREARGDKEAEQEYRRSKEYQQKKLLERIERDKLCTSSFKTYGKNKFSY